MQYLKERLRQVFRRLNRSITESAHYSRYNAPMVGALGVIGYPLYYYIWEHAFPQPYESLWLRLIGALLFLPLLLYRLWPDSLKGYFTGYWLLTMLYGLPFFFSYMLLRNDLSVVWSMSTMAALFLLVLVVYDWLMVIIIAAAGSLLAWAAFLLTADSTLQPIDYLLQLPIYLFVVVAGSIFNYTAHVVKEEKLNAYATVGQNIAHELRTPLLGMKGAASALIAYLPALTEGYEKAREAGLSVRAIRPSRLQGLRDAATHINDEISYSNSIVDMLLMSAGKINVNLDDNQLYGINEIIRNALERYPFRSKDEQRRVIWDQGQDFTVSAPKLLVTHILFNLIKNALHSTLAADKGLVHITSARGEKYNLLTVIDSGQGIAQEEIKQIFNHFHTSKSLGQGSGIGLAFCKMAMEEVGGHIECRSRPGEYAQFSLYFPVTSP